MHKSITPPEYQSFAEFLHQRTGILLGDNKQYLVTSRLNRLLDEHDIPTLTELIVRVQRVNERTLLQSVIDAMTTNETNWFRDQYPFSVLISKLLPELLGSNRGRIWCAACSSGQEPYSISMAVEESKLRVGGFKGEVEIIATDLSVTMIAAAERAEFSDLALSRGLSPERRRRFFTGRPGDVAVLKENIRQRVTFRQLNLSDSYTGLGKFDVVFCRNVLIYFATDLKADILERISRVLKPGGYLFLGASESAAGISDRFEMIRCNPGLVYRLKG